MERTPIDVLHLDDDSAVTDIISRYLVEKNNRTYRSAGNLEEFADALTNCLPKITVIDGKFPDRAGGILGIRTGQAVELLRANPEFNGTKIVIYSGEKNVVEDLAKSYGVPFYQKGTPSYRDMAFKLIEMLGERDVT